MVSPQQGAPSVQTGSSSGAGGLWQAALPGLNNAQSQQAVQAQLALMAKIAANKRYVSETIRKLAPALTNGLPTQAFAFGSPFTFNLPQPNNAYATGIKIRLTLNYTLATGTSAVYGLTAAGALAIYDNIEVVYNKSQIKLRPLWLRQLALAGALDFNSMPSVAGTDGGGQNDSSYLGAYLSPALPVATGANTFQQDLFIPFNILGEDETRGLLPCMPGETGIQVKVTTAAALFGAHPVYNALYAVSGSGHAVSAVSGTIKVVLAYRDGEVYSSPQALPYDMSVLDGTIQMQTDAQLTGLVTGATQVNRGVVTILGKHQYIGLLVVDANQSNAYSVLTNVNYLESAKDSVGANKFWAYGQATNLDVQDFFWQSRIKHNNHDLDPGCMFFVDAPLTGGLAYERGGLADGNQYLDNTTSGWPAWHYGVGLNSINALGGSNTAFIEPFTIFVNPVGLPPV